MILAKINGVSTLFGDSDYAPPLIEIISSPTPSALEGSLGDITCLIVVCDNRADVEQQKEELIFSAEYPILSLGIYPVLITEDMPPPSSVRQIPITTRSISA